MKEFRHLGVYGILIKNDKILLIRKGNGPYKGLLDLPGGTIEFDESPKEALERFMNFHMESYFNESNDVEKIINELKNYFQLFTNEDGTISIKPGCFIFEVKINV